MPTYDYQCKECGKQFERTEHVAEHESAKPACPHCGSKKVDKVMTPFFAKTSKKS